MRYTQTSDRDVKRMLRVIGVGSIDDLFSTVPESLRLARDLDIPEAMSEIELLRDVNALGERNHDCDELTCFLGGGAFTSRSNSNSAARSCPPFRKPLRFTTSTISTPRSTCSLRALTKIVIRPAAGRTTTERWKRRYTKWTSWGRGAVKPSASHPYLARKP